MSNIKAEFEELGRINGEIRRQLELVKKLRERKTSLETSIKSYLNEKNLPGVKYNGDIIKIERKDKKITRGKKDREEELLLLLKNSGANQPEELMEKIKKVGKESVTTERLKITKVE